MASGDLNGDGLLDLVVTRSSTQPPGVGFDVFLGQADGGLSSPISYQGSDEFGALAVGDINGDGWPDVVVAYFADVTFFVNDGTGRLTQWTMLATSEPVRDIGIGDVNGDGFADLVLAEWDDTASSVELILGRGAGSFSAPGPLPGIGGTTLGGFVVGDLNQDGLSDIVTSVSGSANGHQVAVLLGQRDGGFMTSFYQLSFQALALLSGGGAPDLLLGYQSSPSVSTVQILRNSGQGSFSIGPSYDAPGGYLMTVGDFNGDCIPDVATSLCETCGEVTSELSVLYGDGDGGFEPAVSLPYSGIGPCGLATLGSTVGRGILAVGDLCGGGITEYDDLSGQ